MSDRILNNDLLRYLSKTQTDSEPGIRTNTCILLSRLSPHLSSSTRSKVLIPAFARSLRDPFVHARIAGLMSLMAGLESWEKEDLAGKVIPSVGICLVDNRVILTGTDTDTRVRSPLLLHCIQISEGSRVQSYRYVC